MIVGFRHKALRRFYDTGTARGLPTEMIGRIATVLAALDQAQQIEDLNRPSFRLHALKGDLAGYWAVSVSGNWRIVFRFVGTDVEDVDLMDYH
ncbi:type II toxin-antitoxin system RelE/ParE family toxin [Pelagibacterium sp. 26DY04]|uniref:type II toxin-antitoxin system RelE/ParE family toxin n=1 Tax=Pelagibacterium sp. 26DY04 TaxID=2967130 RepID=UPI002814B9D1|nr:type II toxin-antitoxin system RelE/ParE family toxin [Pelagibacterium sp. 26DY04]WMT87053.1 type II toxin-antitoxin system RelE/ParE family toxin [Pelagibacterium sp. 26DY04]